MDIMKAAYDGMKQAVKDINDRRERGMVECPECGNEILITDPCFLNNGICSNCAEETMEDDAICACCHSQAALYDSPFCDLCIEILNDEF